MNTRILNIWYAELHFYVKGLRSLYDMFRVKLTRKCQTTYIQNKKPSNYSTIRTKEEDVDVSTATYHSIRLEFIESLFDLVKFESVFISNVTLRICCNLGLLSFSQYLFCCLGWNGFIGDIIKYQIYYGYPF